MSLLLCIKPHFPLPQFHLQFVAVCNSNLYSIVKSMAHFLEFSLARVTKDH